MQAGKKKEEKKPQNDDNQKVCRNSILRACGHV
jgi:hypothetical protein